MLLDVESYNPDPAVTGPVWASTRSLATTDAITDCFLFLRLLRCFSSAGEPHAIKRDDGPSDRRVSPFGHLRINPCQLVPAAFRRLPRPSSPVEAKASPGCPFAALVSTDLIALLACLQFTLLVCGSKPLRIQKPSSQQVKELNEPIGS